MNFFIDTADTEAIKQIWNRLKDHVKIESLYGITTNPNAFHKLSLNKLNDWRDQIKKVDDVLGDFNTKEDLEIYVQYPSSTGSIDNLLKFADFIYDLDESLNNSTLGIKLPPFKRFLEELHSDTLGFIENINVTGVADAGTALFAFGYEPKFVSVIPGRMKEVGIDYEKHLNYIGQDHGEVITGSMRTIDDLVACIQYDTVPTIGPKVFDLIHEQNRYKEVFGAKRFHPFPEPPDFCPLNTEVNQKLSQDFFKQMDTCGAQAYEDLNNL